MTGYTQIPNCLLDNMAEMQPSEFKALLAVYRLVMGYEEYREKRRRKLSLTRLVDYTGLSRQGVINAMDALENQGFISKASGSGVNEWVVNSVDQQVNSVDHSSQQSLPERSNDLTIASQQSLPERSNHLTIASQQSLPPSKKENISKENKLKKTPKQPTPKKETVFEIPETLNTPAFTAVWNDFVQHRREIKKPLTPLAAKKQLNILAGWGLQRSVVAINYSIAKGWQGIFENKDNQVNGNGHSANGSAVHHSLKNKEIKQVQGEF